MIERNIGLQETHEDADSGLELDMVVRPRVVREARIVARCDLPSLSGQNNETFYISCGSQETLNYLGAGSQPARQEFLRLKRNASRKHNNSGGSLSTINSRPNSITVEDERVPFTRFNSKETSICE